MRYLNTESAAERVGLSARYMRKLRCVGGGPKFIKIGGGNRVAYDIEDLDAWMAAQKFTSTSEVTQRRSAEQVAA